MIFSCSRRPGSRSSRTPRTKLDPTLLLLTIYFVVAFLTTGSLADCYWPDGTENDQHQPCYSPQGGAIGLCCGVGDVCQSNGMCMSHSGNLDARNDDIYYRGSCTFRNWSENQNCPTMCIKGSGISPHTDVGVIPCPNSDTKWYCADGNMNKANCSSGAYIVSLPKPVSFTTVGVSPARTTHTATSTSSSSESTMSAASTAYPGNSTAPAGLPTSIASGTSGAPFATPADGAGSGPSASPGPSVPPNSSSSSSVPLAVGVTIGGASIIAACVIGYFLWRRRKRDELATAESPPPRDIPDDDIMNSVLSAPLFRTASLLNRRPSKTYLNSTGGDGAAPMPDTASVLSSTRTDSVRTGSLLSTFQHQQHQKHSQHGYPQDRFSSDVVVMHSMRRTPPAGWHYHGGHPTTTEPIPEIPYDGRRLPPYHGTPILQHDGFSELPG